MHKIGFVFPGQGSQKQGMLSDLATQYPLVAETFLEASDALGIDLWNIAQEDPREQLNQTEITQPVLLTASVALWRLWNQLQGPRPELLAGHSLGEYSALVCAGVIGFADAVRLVNLRGKLMQTAVPAGSGKMAAILGLDNPKIDEICKQAAAGEVVAAANFNSPGQTVIAGDAAAVERAMALCKEAGAKRALPLPVSVPSHCALMLPAAEKLEQEFADITFNSASIPIVQNVNAEITLQPEAIKQNLIKQLYAPVLWSDSVLVLKDSGIDTLLECGPGKILGGLVKRIDPDMLCLSSDNPDKIQAAIEQLSS